MTRLTLAAATVLSLALGATSVFAQSVGEKTGVNSVFGRRTDYGGLRQGGRPQ